jgi:hypothetical protein
MCDKCDLDMAMYGESSAGFRCSDVTAELLAEEANGIARFPKRKKLAGSDMADISEKSASGSGAKPDTGR